MYFICRVDQKKLDRFQKFVTCVIDNTERRSIYVQYIIRSKRVSNILIKVKYSLY